KLISLQNKMLRPNKKLSKIKLQWKKFFAINREIFVFFDRLAAYSRHSAPLASVYFVTHTFYIVYFLYGILRDYSNFDWQQRSFFVLFATQLSALMCIVTHACSKIVRNNVHIYKANRQFG